MMYKVFKKRILASLCAIVMALPIFGLNTWAVGNIKISDEDYEAYIGGRQVFLCNEKPVQGEVGSEYFMTYTVKNVTQESEFQGLLITEDCTREWPYDEGGFMRYSNNLKPLLQEGATYFIKIKIASGGFRYEITRVQGNAAEELCLEEFVGANTDKTKYFGIWFPSDTKAELINIRCYDVDGNDLGVQLADNGQNINRLVLKTDDLPKKDTEIDYCYNLTVDNQYDVGISNLRIPTTKKVYMEYTVESADYLLSEEGLVLSDAPQKNTVFEFGLYRVNRFAEPQKQVSLLDVGASYLICFERTEKGFTHYIQKTKDGTTSRFVFYDEWGMNFDNRAHYFSLFFGNGGACTVTFHLTNVKCYDANKNNLGVQCNKPMTLKCVNGLEDYAGCEATYYCEKTGDSFALYADRSLKYSVAGQEQYGTYSISDNIMKVQFKDTEGKYDYLYSKITDDKGNEYRRLYNYKVNFVSGTEDEIATQELSNELGYFVMKPEEPKKADKEFEGWYTKDGKEFDFNRLVTKSTTLYAKWEGEELVTDEPVAVKELPILEVSIISIITVAAVVTILVLARKGKKHESNFKE